MSRLCKHTGLCILTLLAGVCAGACSGHGDDGEKHQGLRPGEPTEAHSPATLQFVPAIQDLSLDMRENRGSTTTTLVRSGEWLPDTSYSLTVDDPGGILGALPPVHFGRNSREATITLTYSVSLEPEESRSASISASPAPNLAPEVFTLVLRRPSGWSEAGSGIYHSAGRAVGVSLRVRVSEGRTDYEATGEDGFRRLITLAGDGSVHTAAGAAGIDGFETVADTRDLAAGNLPICSASSSYDSAERLFALNLTYSGATDGVRFDFLRLDNPESEWTGGDYGEFRDGWLLGVVSYEAAPPLDPAENPWPVFVQPHRSLQGLYRVCWLYREASPLSRINSCPTPTYLIIDASDPENVAIGPTFSGFESPGLFAESFTIGGKGTATEQPDGSLRIEIAVPLHNAYGRYGNTWATVLPSVLTVPPSARQ